jgi:hypothetical protein
MSDCRECLAAFMQAENEKGVEGGAGKGEAKMER